MCTHFWNEGAYRICSNGRRSYNYFQVRKDAASIREWLLLSFLLSLHRSTESAILQHLVVLFVTCPIQPLLLGQELLQVYLLYLPLADSLLINSMHPGSRSVTILRGIVNNLQLKQCWMFSSSLPWQLSFPVLWFVLRFVSLHIVPDNYECH